jgi:AbrB family looped-hinge helix DNA binding protein
MDTNTLTRKGQVTIPAHVRACLGLKQGNKVAFVEEGVRSSWCPCPAAWNPRLGS